ncbi:hypothetical protein STEG23_030089 [Scotinomys teguina]
MQMRLRYRKEKLPFAGDDDLHREHLAKVQRLRECGRSSPKGIVCILYFSRSRQETLGTVKGMAGEVMNYRDISEVFPHHDLMPLAHGLLLLSLQLDSGNSAWYLAVDLCICFHQLPEKGFMMTVGVFTNLITRVTQFSRSRSSSSQEFSRDAEPKTH